MWRYVWLTLISLFIITMPNIVIAQTIEELCQAGIAAQDAQNWAEAERLFRQIIQRNPSFEESCGFEAYNRLEALLQQQNRLSEMVEVYRRDLQRNPQRSGFSERLGKILEGLKRFDEA